MQHALGRSSKDFFEVFKIKFLTDDELPTSLTMLITTNNKTFHHKIGQKVSAKDTFNFSIFGQYCEKSSTRKLPILKLKSFK